MVAAKPLLVTFYLNRTTQKQHDFTTYILSIILNDFKQSICHFSLIQKTEQILLFPVLLFLLLYEMMLVLNYFIEIDIINL